jgi:hypothetical protein
MDLLNQTIELYQEYIDQHGKDQRAARWAAVENTIDGLNEERELYRSGEVKTPGQVLNSDV